MSVEASRRYRLRAVPGHPSIRGWMLAGAAAAASWMGWPVLGSVLGFPTVAPAAMVDRTLVAAGAPSGWGPLVVVAGLVLVATGYAAAAARQTPRPTLATGILYGAAMWLIVGAILMPLMGLVVPGADGAASAMTAAAVPGTDPMRPTFMMLHLGPLAPLGALIAWVVFGAILGTAPVWLRRLGVR